VLGASEGLATTLRAAGLRVRLDDREEIRPGFKFNEWELRGVPLRLELGERELDDGQATLVRRDTGAKERTSTDGVASRARELLAEIQRRLLEEAHAFRAEHTLENPKSYEVMREFLEAAGGLAVAPWCGSPTCEDRVKREARATIRCLPLQRVSIKARCIVCESTAVERATWSQAY
jgi:prolyl-tRNA synthetase